MLYGLKTLFGIESINALPHLLFSDEALMQLVGFNTQSGRQGICRRGATKRQGMRAPGLVCPDTPAKNIVKWNLRDLEMVFNGTIGTLAKAGVFGAKGTGIVDDTDLDTTEHYAGPGQVTRKVCMEDMRGKMHALEVIVYGWKVLLMTAV